MIPDSKQRLDSAIRDLKNFLVNLFSNLKAKNMNAGDCVQAQESEDLEETEAFTEAHALLTEVQPLVV